jgi:hypothetical protein
MEHAVGSGHRRPHAGLIGDIALVDLDAQLSQIGGPGRAAHDRDDLVAGFDKLPRHLPADESSCAGQKVPHKHLGVTMNDE